MSDLPGQIRDLCHSFRDGGLPADRFVARFMSLWRTYRDTPDSRDARNHWIDGLMTAVDCFGHPDPRLNLSDDELRQAVAREMP
ncbi:hypothetical protein ACLBXM_20565 [Xanthobacteraceae bacterium A53D]